MLGFDREYLAQMMDDYEINYFRQYDTFSEINPFTSSYCSSLSNSIFVHKKQTWQYWNLTVIFFLFNFI